MNRLPSLKHFHPEFMCLTKPHPIWSTAGSNPYDTAKAIQQSRFLSGRYRSGSITKHWSGNQEGFCLAPSCQNQIETVKHILISCCAYNDTKRRLYSLWLSTPDKTVLRLVLQALSSETDYLLQFILDLKNKE